MHELSLAERALSIAVAHAEREGASRITGVCVTVGELTSMVDDCFRFYWQAVTQGTMAAGSELRFRRVLIALRCRDCSKDFAPGAEDWACPSCGSARVEVTAGEEFYLDSIDIEQPALAVSPEGGSC